jgi:hypothetical protein
MTSMFDWEPLISFCDMSTLKFLSVHGGPTSFFPQSMNSFPVRPKGRKPLPARYLKTNSQYSLSLIILIYKRQFTTAILRSKKKKRFRGPVYNWSQTGYGPRAATYTTLMYMISLTRILVRRN